MNLDQQLNRLRRDFRSCTRCVEAGYLPVANPIFQGRAGNRNLIVGQAPGPRAHLSGVPWSGASGTMLKTWFAMAGFDPEHFLDDWYFTSLTKCFPGKAAAGSGDRVPSTAARALCRSHLDAEIRLVRPPVVVALGRQAIDAILPEARSQTLRDLVGSVWTVDLGYGSVSVIPLPHPSGVGRWLNDPANRALVEMAMVQLKQLRRSLDDQVGCTRRPLNSQPVGPLPAEQE